MVVAGGVLLAGCGSGGAQGGAGSPSSAAKEVPTMPAARFAMPTTMITVAPSQTVTATVAAVTPAPVAPDLARGEGLYASKGCAECHGAQGEGVAGKGSVVAGTPLDYQAFEDLMRTGASGELGPDHLYGPSAISPSGMAALHAWLQSLPPAP
jgi:mono/diheme cytochrome c family protein